MNHKPETLVILAPAFPADEADENWVPSHQSAVRSLKTAVPGTKGINVADRFFFILSVIGRYDWNGVEVVSFDGMRLRKAKRVLLWRDIWRELLRIWRKNKVIGLLSFWCGETALIGHYFGKLYSIRHRCWISGQDAQKGNQWVRFMRPKPEELVAMSSFLQATFYEHYGVRPQRVITNGIDRRMFEGGNETEVGGKRFAGGKERTIDVFSAGSLVPLKQYHLLVEVVALVYKPGCRRSGPCIAGMVRKRTDLNCRSGNWGWKIIFVCWGKDRDGRCCNGCRNRSSFYIPLFFRGVQYGMSRSAVCRCPGDQLLRSRRAIGSAVAYRPERGRNGGKGPGDPAESGYGI